VAVIIVGSSAEVESDDETVIETGSMRNRIYGFTNNFFRQIFLDLCWDEDTLDPNRPVYQQIRWAWVQGLLQLAEKPKAVTREHIINAAAEEQMLGCLFDEMLMAAGVQPEDQIRPMMLVLRVGVGLSAGKIGPMDPPVDQARFDRAIEEADRAFEVMLNIREAQRKELMS
jgi:hypothetical protein